MSSEVNFKKLSVWMDAIEFASSVISLSENLNTNGKHYRIIEQLEAYSTSISANIAEGRGRNTQKEFRQFLYIARGSLYECLSFLYLFHHRGWISDLQYSEIELQGLFIAKKLNALINKISQDSKLALAHKKPDFNG